MTSCVTSNKIVTLVKQNGKFGFIDRKGKWFIEPNFDSLEIFHCGYANCYKRSKAGVIDSKGYLVIDCKYNYIGNFVNGLALVIINDSINYLDLEGNLLLPNNIYDGEDFSCGLAAVQLSQGGQWGYINTYGELVINSVFDYVSEFKNDRANVGMGKNELLIDVKGKVVDTIIREMKLEKFPLIGSSDHNTLGKLNSQGDTIMPMQFVSFGYRQGNKFWFNTGKFYGLADTTGKILTKIKYEYISYFSDNGLALAKSDGKYGFIDKNGKEIIDFQFQDAHGFKYDLAAVKLNDKWGFVNTNGDLVINCEFDNVKYEFKPLMSKYQTMYNFSDE